MCVSGNSGVRTRVQVECGQVKRPSRAHRARVVIPATAGVLFKNGTNVPNLSKSP
jgi:hypothetical protein